MAEQGESQIKISDENGTELNRMLQEATILSRLLVNRGNIENVGIAGSLVKGKESPSDIDLVIMIDDKSALDYQRERINLLRQGSNKKVKLDKYLRLNNTEWNMFSAYYYSVNDPIDIIIISNQPSEEYIKMMADNNIDPNYLENIGDTVHLYDSQTNSFRKENVFNEPQREMIRKASFDRLKQILSDPDHPLYESIEKSNSHRKRIKSMGLEDMTDVSGSNSKIETLNQKREIYENLIKSFDEDPYSSEIWEKVIKLAKSEILMESDNYSTYPIEDLTGYNDYDHLSLFELIKVGEKIRNSKNAEERYKVLLEKSSSGELWYDVVLGYVNDKMFQPIVDVLGLVTAYDAVYQKALDIGCGSGNSLKKISPFCFSCIGLDNFDMALGVARNNKLPVNTTLVKGEATNLPFKKNEFDLVVSNGLTHYLTTEEVETYVTEVNRVLAVGADYFETIATIKEGHVIPRFEDEYLYSAKSVLVCLLDRMCTNDQKILKTRNTVTVLIETFKKLGYSIEFSDFNESDIGYLRFTKKKNN
jgi:ubiquinone/menaquinone biosynthesis C-methylase UbiE